MSRWAVFDWVAGVAEKAELAEAEDEGRDGEVEPVASGWALAGELSLRAFWSSSGRSLT